MKSFSKYLICFIVVALAFCVGVPQAKADSLLFPFFASGGGAFTFFSVQSWSVYNGTVAGGITPNPILAHATYYWVPLTYPTAGTYTINGAGCTHDDFVGTTTVVDLMQWEATEQVNSSLPPINQTSSAPPYLIGTGGPAVGFMIYDDQLNLVPSIEATLPGQAIIVDTNTGLVAGYKALNNFFAPDNATWSFGQPAGVATSLHPTAKLTWLMSNYESTDVNTEWFTVVTGNTPGPALGVPWRGIITLQNGFQTVWDNNENPQSENAKYNIQCFGSFTRTNIMDTAGVIHTNGGGMWWETAGVPCYTDGTNGVGGGGVPAIGGPGACGLSAPGVGTNLAAGAVMLKLESTKILGPGLAGDNIWSLTMENAWPNLPY